MRFHALGKPLVRCCHHSSRLEERRKDEDQDAAWSQKDVVFSGFALHGTPPPGPGATSPFRPALRQVKETFGAFYSEKLQVSLSLSQVIPERFVNYFAWKLSGTIELEAPNGNVYDVRITERRNKTAFVDANHIVESDSLMFRYRGNCRFKVVVFDCSGCEKVFSCARILTNISDQEPSTNSTDISTSFSDGNTHSSARRQSDDCQSGSSGHREDSPYEHESSESDDHTLPTPLYVLSGKCYVTEEDDANIVELVQEIQPEMPSLVAMMTKPSAKPYPDVVIPKDYALAHFPRKNQTIKLQLPEQSKKWYCEFHVKSNGGHCSLYDCGFVRDNHLLEGDLCVFQPMPNCKGRTFKVIVHLFRKATIDHPSSENISKRGLPSTKNTPTLCIKEEPKDDEETFSSGYDEHRISKKYPDHDVMTKTNVRVSLTFGTEYAAKYLRKGDRNLVLQLEGKSQQWHGVMRDHKGALRISGGWTSFASENGLTSASSS
ncbi:hypothetical protein VPH35_076898 [Triticum aestivum]